MAAVRFFPLIVLILSCSVLVNGCSNWSKVMEEVRSRAMGQTATVPRAQAIFPLAYVTTSTRELASPEWVKESVKGTTGVGTWMDDSTLEGSSRGHPDRRRSGHCLRGLSTGGRGCGGYRRKERRKKVAVLSSGTFPGNRRS